MCKRLDFSSWDKVTFKFRECGNPIIVDNFHWLCEEHSAERVVEHKGYHLYDVEMIETGGTIKRRRIANKIIKKEYLKRYLYNIKYQLTYSNWRHKKWLNLLHLHYRLLQKPILKRFDWRVNGRTALDITYSGLLMALDLNVGPNLESLKIPFEVEQNNNNNDDDESWMDWLPESLRESFQKFQDITERRNQYNMEDLAQWLNISQRWELIIVKDTISAVSVNSFAK